ncbi:MAG: DUF3015 family protein [Gammaproteobacteria bacterium]
MKNKLILVSLTIIIGLAAQNGLAEETGAGCGIGKAVMEGKSGKGANIGASILNDILVARTFFMSTAASMDDELLGCDPSQTVMKEQRKDEYLSANMDNLSRDMAQGAGAHLEALATIMEIDEQDKAAFYEMAQQEFAALEFTGSAASVVSGLHTAMLSYPELSKYSR